MRCRFWVWGLEAAEPLLVLPVEWQGLAHEAFEGQVDGLGAIEDGALDFWGKEGQGGSGSHQRLVVARGAGDLLQGGAGFDRAGPAMRIGIFEERAEELF